jgi:hypothetical protein
MGNDGNASSFREQAFWDAFRTFCQLLKNNAGFIHYARLGRDRTHPGRHL